MLFPYQTLDTQVRLDMVRLQLNWLEREIAILRQAMVQPQSPAVFPRTFQSLRGAWAGVVVSDQDFKVSRITLPDNLL
jgi:hypothetical protein